MLELKIVILEDDAVLNKWYELFFSNLSFPKSVITITTDFASFKQEFSKSTFNVAILDNYLPDAKGVDALEYIKANNPLCKVVMISSTDEVEIVANFIKLGAEEFLKKPIDDSKLKAILTSIWDKLNIVDDSNRSVAEVSVQSSGDIIFKSKVIHDILVKISRCATFDSTILIRGESGTGKELVARKIFSMSTRSDKSFIVLNISSLPESLIESELFGHKKGAFTGAIDDRVGRFEEADGGTIFIDEIGDISTTVQVKLLRAIQFKTFQRVGDNKEIKSDVRIITATSRNLEEMIKAGEFREDLYYRLGVISINVPPLRERREDIELLARHFLKKKCEIYGIPAPGFSQRALESLILYNYPGNVRELENIIEHSVIMSRGEYITPEELPINSDITPEETAPGDIGILNGLKKDMGLITILSTVEKELIVDALKASNGNQSAAARSLKISERKLRFRMEKLEIVNEYRSKS